ncbi:hypothetical protein B4U80_03270 [Leptotrombidium deliense]|uniref:Uncharacterized protein n=1 Tax=Leptotrombidium deliense TaxID=299467 RepID=A0A443SIE9_9ACAR|nr:hypothetical protein B4U80_03270 [Leptotrombidium deliense]
MRLFSSHPSRRISPFSVKHDSISAGIFRGPLFLF